MEEAVSLLDVATLIQDQWKELPLSGRTEYRVVSVDGKVVVRARGRNSASGLIRLVEADVNRCPTISWSWRVTQIQEAADLRIKSKEDVAASIFLMFGDPGLLIAPEPVPTLRYVWSNDNVLENAIVENPYMPEIVRSVVVRSSNEHLSKWLTETRNVLADFENAFGHAPPTGIHAVVLFTDNDQTHQPVEAYYEWVRLLCRP